MTDSAIIFLRRQGKSCREVAEQLGCSEYHVWGVMRKRGLSGKYRASGRRKSAWACMTIAGAIDQHGSVEIEAGLNGGYVATVGGCTGEEKEGVLAAVRDAVRMIA